MPPAKRKIPKKRNKQKEKYIKYRPELIFLLISGWCLKKKENKMKIIFRIFFALLLLCFISCKKQKTEEWFVIEKNGSMRDSLCSLNDNGFFSTTKYYKRRNKTLKKGNKPIPVEELPIKLISEQYNWHFSLQIILDSTNRVYMYLGEEKGQEKDHGIHYDDDWKSRFPLYSDYTGLRPEYLLAFDSKYFVDFLKANNDIFGFDINDRDSIFTAVIASTTDTIKNPVLYQLRDLIKGKMNKHFLIRKTSEEENVVLYHKRRNIPYHPEKWRWSTHFLDGRHRPFTPSYDSLERKTTVIYKAVPIMKRQIKRVRHVC